ncbi:cobalt-zinc-cadmium efflux system protein [Bifidobacterium commune]|uniref:Cobalt-zinc-cadmium efflux system protein n=2 Tax=Bifidobacterium commune TaxID=1505727 RepID=A0A1C4GZX8_9BIFI|nr:cobalt-zinc-cadmium efflux system protein [Bifidobacterium commune]
MKARAERPVEEQNDMNTNKAKGNQNRLIVTLGLTLTIFAVEVIGALMTGSLALLVDCAHMLTDVAVLAASTMAAVLMRKKPDKERTWGWARLEPITAGLGALILIAVGVYALVEAILRLAGLSGEEVQDMGMLLGFGILGLVFNLVSVLVLSDQREDNMNMRAAFLETLNDAMGSFAVVVSAVVIMVTGWHGFDAVAGGIIALLIVPRALVLMKNSVKILLEETPSGLDLDEVRKHIKDVERVVGVHDIHASTVATGMPILTAHVVVERGLSMEQGAKILHQLHDCLTDHFSVSIPHTTFQLEPEGFCSLQSEQVHR